MGTGKCKSLFFIAMILAVSIGLFSFQKDERCVLSNLSKPYLWNVNNLDKVKDNAECRKTLKKILKISDGFCELSPIVITDKRHSFADDPHYYCSVGGYWWPDSVAGTYIHKDGERNPLTKEYDFNRLSEFSRRCQYLSVAYYLTREMKYYDAFVNQVKAWFIDKDTYMYPNFMYASVVPGQKGNMGRSSGMIQAYSFIDVIEGLLLVNSINPIKKDTFESLKNWFADFAEWAERGKFGKILRKANNNIGTAYDIILVEMYLFSGKEDKAKLIADGFAEKRLTMQIDSEGKQKAELKRTNAFSYSLYNLSHILDFCLIAEYWYPNYYNDHHDIIDNAYRYLQKYEDDLKGFPYQQIRDWNKCREQLHSQLQRRERLRGKKVNLFVNGDKPVALNVLLN